MSIFLVLGSLVFLLWGGVLGIGLCLSRQIARLHGGDLTLTSSPSHGTRALITLASDRSRLGRTGSVQDLQVPLASTS